MQQTKGLSGVHPPLLSLDISHLKQGWQAEGKNEIRESEKFAARDGPCLQEAVHPPELDQHQPGVRGGDSSDLCIQCFSFLQVIQLMMSLMQEEAVSQFQEISQHL